MRKAILGTVAFAQVWEGLTIYLILCLCYLGLQNHEVLCSVDFALIIGRLSLHLAALLWVGFDIVCPFSLVYTPSQFLLCTSAAASRNGS